MIEERTRSQHAILPNEAFAGNRDAPLINPIGFPRHQIDRHRVEYFVRNYYAGEILRHPVDPGYMGAKPGNFFVKQTQLPFAQI